MAAQNSVHATLVDVSDEILMNAKSRIETSLKRVAKKQFAEKPQVCSAVAAVNDEELLFSTACALIMLG